MDRPGETYIIDGYNLLRRAFRHLEGADLRSSREKLEVRLREFQRTLGTGPRVILVYDGSLEISESPAPRRPDPGLEVVFSRPPLSADETIVEECRRLEGSTALTVVTSDLKDIGKEVRGLRLRHLTSEEFAEVLDDALRRPSPAREGPPPAAPAAEKPSPEEVSAAEVEEWLRVFSKPKSPRRERPR